MIFQPLEYKDVAKTDKSSCFCFIFSCLWIAYSNRNNKCLVHVGNCLHLCDSVTPFFALMKDVCVWFWVYLNDFSCVHQRREISECADDTSFGNQPYKWANLINKWVIFHLKSYAITFSIKNFVVVVVCSCHITLYLQSVCMCVLYAPLSSHNVTLKTQKWVIQQILLALIIYHWEIIYLTLCSNFVCYSFTLLRI